MEVRRRGRLSADLVSAGLHPRLPSRSSCIGSPNVPSATASPGPHPCLLTHPQPCAPLSSLGTQDLLSLQISNRRDTLLEVEVPEL